MPTQAKLPCKSVSGDWGLHFDLRSCFHLFLRHASLRVIPVRVARRVLHECWHCMLWIQVLLLTMFAPCLLCNSTRKFLCVWCAREWRAPKRGVRTAGNGCVRSRVQLITCSADGTKNAIMCVLLLTSCRNPIWNLDRHLSDLDVF